MNALLHFLSSHILSIVHRKAFDSCNAKPKYEKSSYSLYARRAVCAHRGRRPASRRGTGRHQPPHTTPGEEQRRGGADTGSRSQQTAVSSQQGAAHPHPHPHDGAALAPPSPGRSGGGGHGPLLWRTHTPPSGPARPCHTRTQP